jgi:hypothetical protein
MKPPADQRLWALLKEREHCADRDVKRIMKAIAKIVKEVDHA